MADSTLRGRPVIYLAGPMTGYPNYNYGTFDAAETLLHAHGCMVFNPARTFGGDASQPRHLYMRATLSILLTFAATQNAIICMLPEWERSKGATLEVRIAEELGLSIMTFDDLLDALRNVDEH